MEQKIEATIFLGLGLLLGIGRTDPAAWATIVSMLLCSSTILRKGRQFQVIALSV